MNHTIDQNSTFVMWPELYSFYFNVVLNKSSDWGTSPWYWYFLIALPKSITCAIPFMFVGLLYQKRGYAPIDWRVIEMIGPALIFVGLFSVLPHKELRFVMPSITLFNMAGAYGLSKM